LLKPFYVLEIGFQSSFITKAAAFQHGFWPIKTSKNPKAANKFKKLSENFHFS
jgi:hypothetical protein